MQLLWNSLVNLSFAYLILIAVVRIAQEVKTCLSAPARTSKQSL